MDINDKCRCCLTRQSEKDLKSTNTWLGKDEVYADMLKDCFDINILQELCEDEKSNHGICHVCVTRLRDAHEFKAQVLRCQKVLVTKKVEAQTIKVEVKVKAEIIRDSDDDDDDFDNYIPDLKEEVVEVEERRPKRKESKSVTSVKKNNLLSVMIKTPQPIVRPRKITVPADRDIVKKITQRYVQKVMAERKRKVEDMLLKKDFLMKKALIANQPGVSSLRKIQQPIASQSLKPKMYFAENSTIIRRRHKQNLLTILKYSNCTPFGTKTLSGYSCAFCSDTFTEPKYLRTHTNEHHRDGQSTFKFKVDINNLAIKVDISDLTCDICKEQIPDIKSLTTHLVQAHKKKMHLDVRSFIMEFKLNNDNSYDCALCSSTFETFKMLLQHMNNHYRNYVCETCGMGFINLTKLKNHKTTHETGSFVCQICEKVFPTQSKRAYHEKFTHSRVRYSTSCPQCDESFQSYYKRNQHMVLVHNTAAASYKCNICDRNFLLKAQLTNHTKKVHLMERNHVCTECGQGFYQKQYLREHMIKHNGERIHKCDVCQKAYARKKTLREHMRIHNNDRRHKCSVCGLAFVQKCSLKSHLLSNHGINLNSES